MPASPAAGAARVSVIVPTVLAGERAALVRRAIGSVLEQQGVDLEAILVVNGKHHDADLLDEVRRIPRLTTLILEEGNVSLARQTGMEASTGEFFCFLDDDDELLPGALAIRVREMRSHPEADIVVTDGFIARETETRSFSDGMAADIRSDPGLAFLKRNWFDSPAPMFRRATVDRRYFEKRHRYFEWTYLLLSLLCDGKRFQVCEHPTYRKHEEGHASVSGQRTYQLAAPQLLREMLALPLSPPLREGLKRRLAAALNANSNLLLAEGRRWQATARHLECLAAGGWRYLPFTRKLLLPVGRGRQPSAPTET